MSRFATQAREAWGQALPDWVERLAQECDRTSQNKVAKALGRSSALIGGVIRRTYTGDMTDAERRVRGFYMSAELRCPALGVITTHACAEWQSKARDFQSQNPERVRMFRACRNCSVFAEVQREERKSENV